MAETTAQSCLSLADAYYVDENYADAVDSYAAALLVVRETNNNNAEQLLRFRILSHRSSAFYQLGRYAEAVEDAVAAREMLQSASATDSSSNFTGGLLRGESEACWRKEGLAAFRANLFEQALKAFETALQLASLNHRDTTTYQDWIRQCRERLQETKAPKKPPPPAAAAATANPISPSLSDATTTTTPSPSMAKAVASSPIAAAASAVAASNAAAAAAAAASPIKSAPRAAAAAVATTTKTTTATATATATASTPKPPRYQYYQSDNFMTVCIVQPSVQAADLNVSMEPKRLTVVLQMTSTTGSAAGSGKVPVTVLAGPLYQEIDPSRSKVQIKAEKVLVKLRKVTAGYEWPELYSKKTTTATTAASTKKPAAATESSANKGTTTTNTDTAAAAAANGSSDGKDTTAAAVPPATVSPATKQKVARPYASHKDWDSIERDIAAQEAAETPAGDEAMNKLFQTIYAGADDDTRRAMIKSYQTSGGTVLSTNWDEVQKKNYEEERTAPKGMEWKNWEGDKLKMKDDDDDDDDN